MPIGTFVPLAAAGVSAGANLLAGSMSQSAQAEQNAIEARRYKQQAKYQRKMDRKNIELQKQFAQEGIRWKVADAEAAGIHPLYALGAQTSTFSPVTVGGPQSGGRMAETGLAEGLAASGQDISRAINATRTQSERDLAYQESMRRLQLDNAKLENAVLVSQLGRAGNAGMVGPAMPELVSNTGMVAPSVPLGPREPVPQRLNWAGIDWFHNRRTNIYDDWSRVLGDEGVAGMIASIPSVSSFMFTNSLAGRYLYGLPPFGSNPYDNPGHSWWKRK